MNEVSKTTPLERLFGPSASGFLQSLAALTDFVVRVSELILLNVAFEVGARLTGSGLIDIFSTVLRVALAAYLMLGIFNLVNSLDVDRNWAARLILLLGIAAMAFVFFFAIVFLGLVESQVGPLNSGE